jgi:uncharacterized membrane protein
MDGDKMSTAKCKKCGNPISDMYLSQGLCEKCNKEKQKLIHAQFTLRAFGILVTIPLIIGLVLAQIGINSGLTTYFFILWQSSTVLVALIGMYYFTKKLRKY